MREVAPACRQVIMLNACIYTTKNFTCRIVFPCFSIEMWNVSEGTLDAVTACLHSIKYSHLSQITYISPS